jgi:hypothetical protein
MENQVLIMENSAGFQALAGSRWQGLNQDAGLDLAGSGRSGPVGAGLGAGTFLHPELLVS